MAVKKKKSFSSDDLIEILTAKHDKSEDMRETKPNEGNKIAVRKAVRAKKNISARGTVNSVRVQVDITSEVDQAIYQRLAKANAGERKRTDVMRNALETYLSGELEDLRSGD